MLFTITRNSILSIYISTIISIQGLILYVEVFSIFIFIISTIISIHATAHTSSHATAYASNIISSLLNLSS